MTYVRVVRKGEKNVRVLLSDGSTRLLSKAEFLTWTCSTPSRLRFEGFKAVNFGMEFEFCFPTNKTDELERRLSALLGSRFAGNSHHYHITQYSQWQWGTDGSIHAPSGFVGIELKTPIFGISNQSDYSELKSVLSLINEMGGKVNSSTGTHVHLSFGEQRITSEIAHSLFDCYGAWEDKFFDRIVAPSRRTNRYCARCTDHGYSNRYHKLNLQAISSYGTLEFRQHQGTLSYNKIVSWLGVISTWTEKMTAKAFPRARDFDHALSLMQLTPALTTWARSRYEDFND